MTYLRHHVDLAANTVELLPLTEDEIADKTALETQHDEKIQREAELKQARQVVVDAAKTDPTLAALARLLGIE